MKFDKPYMSSSLQNTNYFCFRNKRKHIYMYMYMFLQNRYEGVCQMHYW